MLAWHQIAEHQHRPYNKGHVKQNKINNAYPTRHNGGIFGILRKRFGEQKVLQTEVQYALERDKVYQLQQVLEEKGK